jgi:hypothetical protein
MQQEMDAVERNQTWELADLPAGHRAITLKWVYKLKKDEAEVVIKHKACLVARGIVQQEGVDFDNAFAPVARMESVRLLTLAAQEGWHVHHMDVNSTFLNGDLKEVYSTGRRDSSSPTRRTRFSACARPSTACGRRHELRMPSWTPLSSKWGSSRVLTRLLSTGRARVAMPCW